MIYGGTGAQLFNYFGADSELEDIAGLIGIGVEEFASTSDMLAMRHAVVTRFGLALSPPSQPRRSCRIHFLPKANSTRVRHTTVVILARADMRERVLVCG